MPGSPVIMTRLMDGAEWTGVWTVTGTTDWDDKFYRYLDAPEDINVYELHVRDFSIADTTVSPAYQGKFKAFTESSSNSMQHLKALQEAGLTHIHLLPSFDISTVDEDPGAQINLDNTVDQLCTKLGTEAVSTLDLYCNPSHPAYSQTIRTAMQEAVAAHADTEVPQRLMGP